jgi:hypothetical protein
MRSLDDVFAGLNRSAFHRKFHLRAQEQAYSSMPPPTVAGDAWRSFMEFLPVVR